MRSGHCVDGSLHSTNLHIIPTYTYINKETRLAKFPALSRVIKFKYHVEGGGGGEVRREGGGGRDGDEKKNKLANEKARDKMYIRENARRQSVNGAKGKRRDGTSATSPERVKLALVGCTWQKMRDTGKTACVLLITITAPVMHINSKGVLLMV